MFKKFINWLDGGGPGKDRGSHWTRILWTMGHDSSAKRNDLNAYLNDLRNLASQIEKEQGSGNVYYRMILAEIKYWEVHSKDDRH